MHKFGQNAENPPTSGQRLDVIHTWWQLSGSKTGNCADVFTLCLFFLAFIELLSSPLCCSLSITSWHLPAAKAHTHSLGLRLWLEYEAGFCYEMCHEKCWKLRWRGGWDIPCDPVDATNKQNHKSLFKNIIRFCLVELKSVMASA